MYLGLDVSHFHQGQYFQELVCPSGRHHIVVIIVHSLNHIQLFTPLWTAARPLCPPLSPRVCSDSCPLSQWCYLSIASSAAPFSSFPQSFLALESFPMSQVFASGSQVIRTSASVLPVNIQGWFLWDRLVWSLAVQGILRIFSGTTIQKHQLFGAQPSLWSTAHIHTWVLGKP